MIWNPHTKDWRDEDTGEVVLTQEQASAEVTRALEAREPYKVFTGVTITSDNPAGRTSCCFRLPGGGHSSA